MKRKNVEKRLQYWYGRLAEFNMFGCSTEDEFQEWISRYSAKQFKAEPVVAKSLSKAAEFFKLDKTKPAHRAFLLGILAHVLFGDPGRAGRPRGQKKWTRSKLMKLWHYWAEVKNEEPKVTLARAAEIIKRRHGYSSISTEMLRQRLIEACQVTRWLEEKKKLRDEYEKLSAEALRNGGKPGRQREPYEVYYVARKYGLSKK